MRLAFARISQETNSFSSWATTLADFEQFQLLEGPAVEGLLGRWDREIPGYFHTAELTGFAHIVRRAGLEAVPLLSAWAMPAGPVTEETFTELLGRLLRRLALAERVDGLYLCLHGAMGVDGRDDAEADLLAAVRAALGDRPLVVSFDLHANLTQAKVDLADAIVGYRTNPHRDHGATGARAARLLVDLVNAKLRPTTAWRKLPMLLGGGSTLDFAGPMRAVFRRMSAMERDPRVLHVATWMAHPFLDAPGQGWAVSAVTDGDPGLAEALVDELAARCWDRRDAPGPAWLPPADALQLAADAWLARRLGTVCLCDAGDVVGAGAPGTSTALLERLVGDHPQLRAYVTVQARAEVERLYPLPPGSRVTVRLPRTPGDGVVELTGELVRSGDPGWCRVVVVRHERLHLLVVERPTPVMHPWLFTRLGLSPWRADVVVVKNFFPFRLQFALYNRRTLYAATPGPTDVNGLGERLTRVPRPIHPFDPGVRR